MAKITLKPLDKNDPLFKQGFITYKKKNHKVKNKTNKKSKIIDEKIRKDIKG
tara:strand:- start:50 stop:205 length:156 start_codon:yes stop_codon:yes gene_type:complete